MGRVGGGAWWEDGGGRGGAGREGRGGAVWTEKGRDKKNDIPKYNLCRKFEVTVVYTEISLMLTLMVENSVGKKTWKVRLCV